MEKVSVFIKIRVLFWPEISALGVLFNFDNERMRPPKYSSAPPGAYLTQKLRASMTPGLYASVNIFELPNFFQTLSTSPKSIQGVSNYM